MTASQHDWETKPLPAARTTIAYDRRYSAKEFARLSAGHVPRDMDEKWFVYFEEPWLYLHRSWTGYCIFQVRFEKAGRGFRVAEAFVSRDPEQYSSTDDDEDASLLGTLLDEFAAGDPAASSAERGAGSASSPLASLPPVLAGVAGEYFVAAELSRRGYIASISLRNTRGIDILATNQDGSQSVTIQCKTSQKSKKRWVLNKKSEDFVSPTHFYVFVLLGAADERPQYHVVPSQDVAAYLKADHAKWIATPGRGGRKHVDNSVRVFVDKDDAYLERWDLLGL
jgi:hypothetical protein